MRGKPSRMKDAEGASEGREGAVSERDVVGETQDLAFSSPRMRRRIISSGTSEPDFMCSCASCPNGVLFRTALRSRSPELTAESWGNRFMRRSACVPLPTPGAPTRIIRAARLNSFVAIAEGVVRERSWGLGGSAAWYANVGVVSCAGQLEARGFGNLWSQPHLVKYAMCTNVQRVLESRNGAWRC